MQCSTISFVVLEINECQDQWCTENSKEYVWDIYVLYWSTPFHPSFISLFEDVYKLGTFIYIIHKYKIQMDTTYTYTGVPKFVPMDLTMQILVKF